ncbi:putative peptidoglycan endopeptidase LytE [Heyndrickxia sporothermodurans]|nr:putative peptidoglycan endopeptidase LytE [Heyndrickxia sporothermodurans]
MKKTIVSVAATTIITGAIASPSLAATHKVKKGDSLWTIAQKYNTTVSNLIEWNHLKSDLIMPNQVLTVSKTGKTVSSVSSSNTSTAKTYKVKSGDSLSKIALMYKVTVDNLKSWNNLKSHIIYPGDVLKVSKSTTTSSSSSSTQKPATPSKPTVVPEGSYIVKAGDTLGKISLETGISVAELKRLNSLKSDLIYVGQKLVINKKTGSANPPKVEAPTQDVQFSTTKLVNTATKQLGVPYVWGGSSVTGFDCSGFIYYVFNQSGVRLPRTSSEGYFNRSYYIKSPQIGDLVFFAGTYKKGISHLGIYIGNNQFIHAGSDGVQISSLNNSYWKSHFDSFKRLY